MDDKPKPVFVEPKPPKPDDVVLLVPNPVPVVPNRDGCCVVVPNAPVVVVG